MRIPKDSPAGRRQFALQMEQRRDSEKVRVARRLRAETTVSLKWIAQRLEMGCWTHAANPIYDKQKSTQRAKHRPGV
jgi:hypothetical protein